MGRKPIIGDFGWRRTYVRREQVVGIFDLVGFTDIESNKGLFAAVRSMETQIEMEIGEEDYSWDDRERGGRSVEAKHNEILLRPTGDGYIIAFSEADVEIEVLNCLTKIHNGIKNSGYQVKLGINRGANFVLKDLCERVNIIGCGINFAARAVQFAQPDQIICTSYFAKPLMEEHGNIFTSDIMIDLGEHQIKNTKLELYNYYKEGEFGAPIVDS